MLCGVVAFGENMTADQLIEYFTNTDFKNIHPDYNTLKDLSDCSDSAVDLIKNLLKEPETRFGRSFNLDRLITHKFFTKGVDIQDIL